MAKKRGFVLHSKAEQMRALGRPLGENIVEYPARVNTATDTVNPKVLMYGYTAHDNRGRPIVGEYVNPYNANTEQDTVIADVLLEGYTAHDASGAPITGSLKKSTGTKSSAGLITQGAYVTAGAAKSTLTIKIT